MKERLILVLLVIVLVTSCKDRKKGLAISKIKDASKLATTKTTLKKMIFADQDKRFLGVFKLNTSCFAAYTTAYILAGIDFSKIQEKDVKISGSSISINLPAVEVIDFSYPFSEYKIDYNLTQEAFANKIKIQDHEKLYEQAESQIREQLPYMGIKEATQNKTSQLVQSLLQSLGYTEIYISFKDGPFIQQVDLTDKDLQE